MLHHLKPNYNKKRKKQELKVLVKTQSMFLKNYSTSFRIWDTTMYIIYILFTPKYSAYF